MTKARGDQPDTTTDLSEAARAVVRDAGDPRIDAHLAALGLGPEPVAPPAPMAPPVSAEPDPPVAAVDPPELAALRDEVRSLETALAAARSSVRWLTAALVAALALAVVLAALLLVRPG